MPLQLFQCWGNKKCLALRRLKPATPQSQVVHHTTVPLIISYNKRQGLLWHDKILAETVARGRRIKRSTYRIVVDTDVILKYLICKENNETNLQELVNDVKSSKMQKN